MTRNDWARIKAIVGGALVRPDAERAAYVMAHCGGDDALRHEVESLLAAAVSAAKRYDDPTLLVAGTRPTIDAFGDLPAVPAVLPGVWSPAQDASPGVDFEGTDRYVVCRHIGTGGMGVVYEVEDRVRHQRVALKTLRRWQAADIYRLKHEFRSLTDIAHPNLASLHDLVVDEGQCFFTMELVEGVTFVEYVRASSSTEGTADIDRVRGTLPQLIDGVRELHRRGKLHGDIKPSNVLVTPEGRVVILDFSLTSTRARNDNLERGVAGTPAYLSPEQCRGLETTEASDWYGVGATLYHALTGRPPFEGFLAEVINRKITSDPVAVSAAAAGVPEDLADICMAMLCREPAARLSGREALGRMGAAAYPSSIADGIPEPAFVGREPYLEALTEALAAVTGGRSASVYIYGPSGIGKTALVQRFFDAHVAGTRCLALRSQCHEHESVPYKGLDGVIDGLSRYLSGLPHPEISRLMPPDAAMLAKLFPVMQLSAAAAASVPDIADPVVLRQRAFAALRDLVARVAERQPLVVEIDDFHWADADSAASLTALLKPPNPPPLLLLISFRSEEIDAKPFLRAFLDHADMWTRIALPVAPMTENEVDRLISTLLPFDVRTGDDERRAIVREADGNPFLVEELTRAVVLGAGPHRGATLGEMLERRLDAHPPESRVFLETLAVCGRPIRAARIFEACGLSGDERPLVARLQAAHFLRGSRSAEHVEIYHDRIRDALAARVSRAATRQIHERMVRTLIAHGDDDPEALFEHHRGAGHETLAAGQAAVAAARASAVLAFDRAAAFYRAALDLQPDAGARAEWKAGLAKALENAGRPVEAAESYLDAARETPVADQLEWRRKAAELLLIGGQIDRGLEVSDAVLRATGVRLARTPLTAIASLALRRHQLRWRGFEFDRRPNTPIAQHDLGRIDACWSITVGLAMVDPLRVASLNARQLLWALDVGDPFRIARALALEAGFSVIIPVAGGGRRSAVLSRTALDLAGDSHYVAALASLWAGIGVFLTGRWTEATPLCESAMTTLRDHCTGVIWELNLAQSFFLFSLAYRGRLREVARHLPGLSQSARERGNVYLELELSTRLSLVRLAADDPIDAEGRANEAMARWSQRGFQRPHYHHLLTLIQTRLYRGLTREAWTLIEQHERVLGQSLFRRVQHTRIEVAVTRARCALAMAAAGEDAARMRAIATRNAARIERENMPWSNPFARLIRATVAHQEGRAEAAAEGLAAAIDGFDAVDMRLYAAVCRRRLAAIAGGDRGRALGRDAEDWMAAEAIRNPAAMSRFVAPGLPEP